jgi:hypothetical protein
MIHTRAKYPAPAGVPQNHRRRIDRMPGRAQTQLQFLARPAITTPLPPLLEMHHVNHLTAQPAATDWRFVSQRALKDASNDPVSSDRKPITISTA